MVVKEISYSGSFDFKAVKYEMIQLSSFGKLLIFVEGDESINSDVCKWISIWIKEYNVKSDRLRVLEELIIRTNSKLLEMNKENKNKAYVSLSLIYIEDEKRWFVNYGGNCVVSCKKDNERDKFGPGVKFCSENFISLGRGEIHKIEYELIIDTKSEKGIIEIKDKKIVKSGRNIFNVQQKKYINKNGTERILVFGSEYCKFLKNYEIDCAGFINKNVSLDVVVDNIQKSIQRYVINRTNNGNQYNCLTGIVIEIVI